MPEPQARDAHVDAVLTNLSVAYIQQQADFIAGQFAPNVPVAKEADRYFRYVPEDWFTDEVEERADGAESAGSGYRLDNTPSYFARTYAFHKDVSDRVVANSDVPLRPFDDAQAFVSQKFLIKKERIFAQQWFATGVWGRERAGVSASPTGDQFLQWDQANSIPIDLVDAEKARMLEQTGFEPNTLVLGYRVFNRLKRHSTIIELIKYGASAGQPALVTPQLLAQVFGVQRVLVAKATVNVAAKGATKSMTFIQGNHAMLAYVAPNPGLRQPSAAYTFSWTGLLGGGAFGNRISRFRMEHLKSDRVEGEMAFDMKIVGIDLGVFFLDAVAT